MGSTEPGPAPRRFRLIYGPSPGRSHGADMKALQGRAGTACSLRAAGARGMKMLERSVYRGPHLYSVQPMVRIRIDLGELEHWPSDRMPDFPERLTALLPGLSNHGCSYREPDGFLRRLREGGSAMSSSMSRWSSRPWPAAWSCAARPVRRRAVRSL